MLPSPSPAPDAGGDGASAGSAPPPAAVPSRVAIVALLPVPLGMRRDARASR